MLPNSQKKADYKKKKGVGTYRLYPLVGFSHCLVADKDNSPHQRICKKPLWAIHTQRRGAIAYYLRVLENFARIYL